MALQQAGLALNALDVSARQQDQALQSLIATAGGKFITSIAGLLCSLVWNWRAKVALENLQSSIDTLCHTLRSKVPDNAAEASVRMQLALFQDILDENRSQVSQLRRFEGDFANAIGDALSRNMQPAFDKLAQLADSTGLTPAGALDPEGALLDPGPARPRHIGDGAIRQRRPVAEQGRSRAQHLAGDGDRGRRRLGAGRRHRSRRGT